MVPPGSRRLRHASWSTWAGRWDLPAVCHSSTSARTAPTARCIAGWAAAAGKPDIQVVDEARGLVRAHGKDVIVLREARNPKDIPWRDYGVTLVVDCTGKFRDPHADADDAKGALRGHLAAGARAVVHQLPVQEQGEGRPAARGLGRPYPRDQPPGLRSGQAQDGVGGLLHHHGSRAHDAAAPRPGPHPQHDHGGHEHRPRGHQQPAACWTRSPAPAPPTCARPGRA